jgi:hypothetical protein
MVLKIDDFLSAVLSWMYPIRPFFLFWRNNPQWARTSSFTRFLDQTQRHTTVGRTPLDEWSAHRRDNTQHSQQTNIHAHCGIRTHSISRQAVGDLRIRPRGLWDRLKLTLTKINVGPQNPSMFSTHHCSGIPQYLQTTLWIDSKANGWRPHPKLPFTIFFLLISCSSCILTASWNRLHNITGRHIAEDGNFLDSFPVWRPISVAISSTSTAPSISLCLYQHLMAHYNGLYQDLFIATGCSNWVTWPKLPFRWPHNQENYVDHRQW